MLQPLVHRTKVSQKYSNESLHYHRAGLLGAAINLGQDKGGVSLAPDSLRKNHITQQLLDHGFRVEDFGNVTNRSGRGDTVGDVFFALYEECLAMAADKDFSLVVGGDHSIALSSVAAQLKKYPDLSVLWVDAHGDINTPSTSPTGNLHGMPVALLLGLIESGELPGFEWHPGGLRPEKIAYIGVRDLDAGEKKIISDLGIALYTAEEVNDRGMSRVLSDAMMKIDPEGISPLHLSFDIDGVDPELAPATGLRVPGGLNKQHVHELGEFVAQTGRLVSADFVELNPEEAANNEELLESVGILLDLLDTMLGQDTVVYHSYA